MSELFECIDGHDYDYKKLENLLTKPPYNLEFKTQEDDNLFLICNTKYSDVSLKVVRECNGIILDKKSCEFVCYGIDRCLDSIDDRNMINSISMEYDDFENLDGYNDINFPSLDGTLIRLYNYKDEWFMSTTRKINAENSYWTSSKNFKKLFEEAIDICYETLDKNNTYTFILQHHESTQIYKVNMPKAVLISVRSNDTWKEDYKLEDCQVYMKVYNYDTKSYEIVPCNTMSNTSKNDFEAVRGEIYILSDGFLRIKVDTKEYRLISEARGSKRDLHERYVELMKNNDKLMEILEKHYPEENLELYKIRYNKMCKYLQNRYFQTYVLKNKTFPTYDFLLQTLKQLHGRFKYTGEKTTIDVVNKQLQSLDTKVLYNLLKQFN